MKRGSVKPFRSAIDDQPPMRELAVCLPVEDYEALEAQSKRSRQSMSALGRIAVQMLLHENRVGAR